MNRIAQSYAKEHWTDAVCVGETGASVHIPKALKPLIIKAIGRGKRQVVRTDKYGFPCAKAGRIKRVFGFQMGDQVKLIQPRGKYAGTHFGRLASIRKTGILDIKTITGKISASWKHFALIQRTDKYAGTHFGRLASIRKTGILDIKTITGKISASWKHFTLIQRTDGYAYGY